MLEQKKELKNLKNYFIISIFENLKYIKIIKNNIDKNTIKSENF